MHTTTKLHHKILFSSCFLSPFYTVKSFVKLSRYVLQLPEVLYFLSAKLCQDPLECFFGKQRMRGGRCDNPTVQAFMYGTSSLRVQGCTALKPVCGNCKCGWTKENINVDDTPLPKKQRKQQHAWMTINIHVHVIIVIIQMYVVYKFCHFK